jgi:hypothetical protein
LTAIEAMHDQLLEIKTALEKNIWKIVRPRNEINISKSAEEHLL